MCDYVETQKSTTDWGCRRKPDQSRNAADTYLVESWGYYLNYATFWMVEKKYCTTDFRLAFLLVWNYQSMLCDRRVEPIEFLTFFLNPFRACFSSCNHHVFLWKCKTCLRWWWHVWLCMCGSNQVLQFNVMSCPYSGVQLIFICDEFKVYANAESTG